MCHLEIEAAEVKMENGNQAAVWWLRNENRLNFWVYGLHNINVYCPTNLLISDPVYKTQVRHSLNEVREVSVEWQI